MSTQRKRWPRGAAVAGRDGGYFEICGPGHFPGLVIIRSPLSDYMWLCLADNMRPLTSLARDLLRVAKAGR